MHLNRFSEVPRKLILIIQKQWNRPVLWEINRFEVKNNCREYYFCAMKLVPTLTISYQRWKTCGFLTPFWTTSKGTVVLSSYKLSYNLTHKSYKVFLSCFGTFHPHFFQVMLCCRLGNRTDHRLLPISSMDKAALLCFKENLTIQGHELYWSTSRDREWT